MKKLFEILSFVFLVAILATTVSAQTTPADVAMLDKKGPESYPDCVERFARIFGDHIPKRVFQDCKDLAKDASKTSRKIMGDDARSRRPNVIVSGGYGYSTGGFVRPYNEWSYTSSRTTSTSFSGGGTVRGYSSPTNAPTPAPQKPGPPGTK